MAISCSLLRYAPCASSSFGHALDVADVPVGEEALRGVAEEGADARHESALEVVEDPSGVLQLSDAAHAAIAQGLLAVRLPEELARLDGGAEPHLR